jgi:hypothetical protein
MQMKKINPAFQPSHQTLDEEPVQLHVERVKRIESRPPNGDAA